MRRRIKSILTAVLTAALVLGGINVLPMGAQAAEGDEYEMYVGFGGDFTEGSWDAAPSESVTATAAVGDTVTIGLKFDSPVVYTWWMAPVLLAEGVSDVSYTIDSLTIDGEDVTDQLDLSAGDAWWYEGTDDYDETQSIRLAGGYNEWGTVYLPINDITDGFTEIMYTITLNDVATGDGYKMYVGFGGDFTEGSWDAAPSESVSATAAVGDTVTIGLKFDSPVVYTWWMAPVLVAEGVSDLSYSIDSLTLDGEDITDQLDLSAGDAWWYEGTDDYDETQSIRLAGGYNEWGTVYLPINDISDGFTEIMYTITIDSMEVGGEVEEEEAASAAGDVDLGGTYNAYLGIQTPSYSFRNAFDDATYGRDTDYFWQVTGWEGADAVTEPGTFTDAVIAGNGTYTVSVDGLDFPDGEFADQDYMNLIFISTDIPNTGAITISDVSLQIDGKSVELASAGAIVSPDSVDYLNILLQNIWNDDVKTLGYYGVPMSSISVTFTVSGFNYDAAATEEPAEEVTEPAAEETVTTESSSSGLSAGYIVVIVIVIILVIVIIVLIIVEVMRRKKNKNDADGTDAKPES